MISTEEIHEQAGEHDTSTVKMSLPNRRPCISWKASSASLGSSYSTKANLLKVSLCGYVGRGFDTVWRSCFAVPGCRIVRVVQSWKLSANAARKRNASWQTGEQEGTTAKGKKREQEGGAALKVQIGLWKRGGYRTVRIRRLDPWHACQVQIL